MPKKDISVLRSEYKKLVDNGEHDKAKDYLASNILLFPKKIQEKIRMFLFELALKDLIKSDDRVLTQFQSDGIKIMKELEQIKKELEDKEKVLKIKNSLQK